MLSFSQYVRQEASKPSLPQRTIRTTRTSRKLNIPKPADVGTENPILEGVDSNMIYTSSSSSERGCKILPTLSKEQESSNVIHEKLELISDAASSKENAAKRVHFSLASDDLYLSSIDPKSILKHSTKYTTKININKVQNKHVSVHRLSVVASARATMSFKEFAISRGKWTVLSHLEHLIQKQNKNWGASIAVMWDFQTESEDLKEIRLCRWLSSYLYS